MNWRNTANAYGLIQIILHWTIAAMIAVLIPLGLWMTGLDYYDPWYNRGPDLHRALGVLLGLLLLVRTGVRLSLVQPLPLARSGWEAMAVKAAHGLLYLLPLLLVVSGYLISTADGRAVEVFGWFEIPATLHGVDGQADVAGEIHFVLAMLLLAVVIVHTLAAFHHHWILRDTSLRRMLKPDPSPSR